LAFKLNQAGRHHIPRQRRKVTNWPAYDASLRQRGSLTVWFTEEAVDAWAAEPRTTRGGQPWYSPLAILTALTLRAVFRLAFRQTEGLIGSMSRPEPIKLTLPGSLRPIWLAKAWPNVGPHCRTVSWLTAMPRAASIPSTMRRLSGKRK